MPRKQISAVRRGKEILRAPLDDLQAMSKETKIGDDPGVQQADRVCRNRVSEARKDLLGDASSSYNCSLLDDFDLKPCHPEIRGAGKTVVTRADDDDVI